MAHFVPESAVLKPKDPTAVEDDWPIFVLNDAIVYRPDGVTMANAILVAKEGPCTVRGRLEVEDKEDFQYLVKPNVRTANMEATGIENYSIGDDPQGVIWLASSAGWLEINPHPSYEPIYRSMCDMIVLYYILFGIYTKAAEQDPKNRWKILATLDVKEILFEYAVAIGDGTTYEETVDKCVRLGPMLLAHFRLATDLDWPKSSFYKWLDKEVRDHERSARSSSRGESVIPPEPVAATTAPAAVAVIPVPVSSYPTSVQAAAVPHQLPFRASPAVAGAASREAPVPLPPHTTPSLSAAAATQSTPSKATTPTAAPAAPAASTVPIPADLHARVLDAYVEVVEALGTDFGDPMRMSVGKVHYGVFSKFRVRTYNTGKHLSAFFKNELRERLSDRWRGSPYETWLSSKEAQDFTPETDQFLLDAPEQLVRRNQQAPPSNSSSTPAAASPSAAAVSSAAAASLSRSNSPAAHSPRTAGKRAVLRPPTVSRKRRFDSTENGGSAAGGDTDADVASRGSTPRPVGRPRKVPRNSQDDGVSNLNRAPTQAMQIDSDSGSSSDTDGDDSDDAKDETMLAIHTESLLVSTKPTGPNRTWTCPEPGCDYIVRDVPDEDDSEEDSENGASAQIQIQAHLRGHEEEMLSRVDLAISEGTRRHVSVNHLLDKIRALADNDSQRTPAVGEVAAATGARKRSRVFF
ncbi:hypothetical protein SEUCBS139899_006799 [Sporothrix eucalyptigena]|uniref:DNA (cytosine-5)-methyltransferase 1 replication foci domain-containing protein n=1 Tax=Sporothrix eucalyptigena TaxID=1812306 RepID=A0ABP0BHQ8_9PEZI